MGIGRRIKVAIGVLVVAMPLGVVGAMEGPSLIAGASAAPAFPATCRISATVSFNPPLVAGGLSGPSEPNEVATVDNISLTDCLSSNGIGAPTSGTAAPVTITTAPAKAGKINKVKQFNTANCGSFASTTTLKELKHFSLTISWSGNSGTGQTLVSTKKATAAVGPGAEVGFLLSGPATGDYATKVGQSVAYVANDANGVNLLSGCAGGPVSSITIDSATSTVSV